MFAKKIYGDSFPKLITVSRLDGRKSHRNILMTVKNLLPKYPNLKYVSVGDGVEKNNLENLKNELGLNNEAVLIYKTTEQQKLALLDKSDLFIMPSIVHKNLLRDLVLHLLKQHLMANHLLVASMEVSQML